jgi:hypothetical protein
MRRLATWLAILAMALQALWPLIAQARPATLVPVCTVGGVTHYVEVPVGGSPADSQHEHCALCVTGSAPVIASAPTAPPQVALDAPALPPDRASGVPPEVREHPARPRAPPLPR